MFLDYFASKNHVIIGGASLIPEHDPSVLFTTAGMHPLVPFLMGESHPAGRRLAKLVQRLFLKTISDLKRMYLSGADERTTRVIPDPCFVQLGNTATAKRIPFPVREEFKKRLRTNCGTQVAHCEERLSRNTCLAAGFCTMCSPWNRMSTLNSRCLPRKHEGLVLK